VRICWPLIAQWSVPMEAPRSPFVSMRFLSPFFFALPWRACAVRLFFLPDSKKGLSGRLGFFPCHSLSRECTSPLGLCGGFPGSVCLPRTQPPHPPVRLQDPPPSLPGSFIFPPPFFSVENTEVPVTGSRRSKVQDVLPCLQVVYKPPPSRLSRGHFQARLSRTLRDSTDPFIFRIRKKRQPPWLLFSILS